MRMLLLVAISVGWSVTIITFNANGDRRAVPAGEMTSLAKRQPPAPETKDPETEDPNSITIPTAPEGKCPPGHHWLGRFCRNPITREREWYELCGWYGYTNDGRGERDFTDPLTTKETKVKGECVHGKVCEALYDENRISRVVCRPKTEIYGPRPILPKPVPAADQDRGKRPMSLRMANDVDIRDFWLREMQLYPTDPASSMPPPPPRTHRYAYNLPITRDVPHASVTASLQTPDVHGTGVRSPTLRDSDLASTKRKPVVLDGGELYEINIRLNKKGKMEFEREEAPLLCTSRSSEANACEATTSTALQAGDSLDFELDTYLDSNDFDLAMQDILGQPQIWDLDALFGPPPKQP